MPPTSPNVPTLLVKCCYFGNSQMHRKWLFLTEFVVLLAHNCTFLHLREWDHISAKPRRNIKAVYQHSSRLLTHLTVCAGRSGAQLALIVCRCFGKLTGIFQHPRSNKSRPGFHANRLPKMASASLSRHRNQHWGNSFQPGREEEGVPKHFSITEK